jgi:mannosyl-3-phosphoglycerate phosphatase
MTLDNNAIIFTDLDGTLLDHDTYQYDAVVALIQAMQEQGIPIIPVTSKTFEEVTYIQKQLNISGPLVVENGAAIYLPKRSHLKQPTDSESIGDYWVVSFSEPRSYWCDLIEQLKSKYAGAFRGFSDMSIEDIAKVTSLPMDAASRASQRQFAEPLYWMSDLETKQALAKELSSLGANVIQGARFVHVSGKFDKGQAVTWLMKVFQQSNHQCYSIALGDGPNDIAMLEVTDKAVRIRSDHHPYPELTREDNVYSSTLVGPKGWAEVLSRLLSQDVLQGEVDG